MCRLADVPVAAYPRVRVSKQEKQHLRTYIYTTPVRELWDFSNTLENHLNKTEVKDCVADVCVAGSSSPNFWWGNVTSSTSIDKRPVWKSRDFRDNPERVRRVL